MKQYILLFEDFEHTYTGNDVAEYIISETPDISDIPDFFISHYIKPNTFIIKKVNLEELLKSDPSFKEYHDSGAIRYGQDANDGENFDYEPQPDNVYNPIVVFNGEVLDGYSRASTLLHSNETTANAYVNITSNNAK